MTVFHVAPTLQVLAISFTEPQPRLGNYERPFTSESIHRGVLKTLRIGVITAAFSPG